MMQNLEVARPLFGKLPTKRASWPYDHPAAVSLVIAVLITLAAALTVTAVGVVPMGRYTHDFIAIMDGAYRITQGMVPHVDFAVPHGSFPLYQGVLPFVLRNWINAFAFYQLLGWISIAPIATWIAMRQSAPWKAVSVLCIVVTATIIPYVMELDNSPELSYYAAYNRLSTACLFLVVMWALSPGKRSRKAEPILLSYLLLLLLGTKITAFIAAAGFLTLYGFLTPVARSALYRATALLLGWIVILQISLGLPAAYAHDVLAMLAISGGGMGFAIFKTVARNPVPVLCAIGLLLATLPRASHSGGGRSVLKRPTALARLYRAPMLILAAAGLSVVVESQNTGSLGLIVLLALCLTGIPLRRRPGHYGPVLAAALLVACLAPWVTSLSSRGTYLLSVQARSLVPDPALSSVLPRSMVPSATAALADDYMRIWRMTARPVDPLQLSVSWDASSSVEPAVFLAQMRLAYEALEKSIRLNLVRQESRIFNLGQVQIFPMLLNAPSPPGVGLWHGIRTFAPAPPSELASLLQNVDIVYQPLCGLSREEEYLREIFQPVLINRFTRRPLTECWQAWTQT